MPPRSRAAGRPRRRSLSRPALLSGTAIGAVAALAAGVLFVSSPGLDARRPAPGDRTRHTSATGPGARHMYVATEERPLGSATGEPGRPVLLSLAVTVAHNRSASGQYWCNVSTTAKLDPIGPDATELTPRGQGQPASPVSDYRYTLAERFRSDACWERGQIGMIWASNQDLGARPATPADVAAWRRAGSPSVWQSWYDPNAPIHRARGPLQVGPGKRGGRPSLGDGVPVPTNPAKLRAALLSLARATTPRDVWRHQSRQATAAALFQQARVLLLSPLTPAQRAADYQVLAAVPGIRTKPEVKDPSGRIGTALWLGSPTWIIVVDPVTGMLLADEWLAWKPPSVYAPGTVTQYFLWTSRWTDKLP